MKKMILVLAAFGLFLSFGVPAAEASLITIKVESASIPLDLFIIDGGSGDVDGVVNDSITVSESFNNGMDFFVSVGTSAPESGDLGRLLLNTFHMQGSGPGDIKVTLTKGVYSAFTGQASATGDFFGTLQAASGSTVSAQSWVDATPVYAPGGNPVHTAGGEETFGFSDTEQVNLAGNFLLVTEIALTFTPGGGILSITDANVGVIPISSVPEPGSLVLFGSGLLGLATVVRRKNKSKKPSEVASSAS